MKKKNNNSLREIFDKYHHISDWKSYAQVNYIKAEAQTICSRFITLFE